MKFVINPLFRDALSPLDKQTRDELRSDIEANGIRHKVILRTGTDEIVDGYHRYAIATELGIAIPYEYRYFATDQDVLDFIHLNQTSRRNATPAELSLYRGRLYHKLKSEPNEGVKASGRTSEVLAEQHGVSDRTIKRDAEKAAAFEKLAESLRPGYTSGAMPLTHEELLELAKLPVAAQIELARNVRTGKLKNWKEALFGARKRKSAATAEAKESQPKSPGKKSGAHAKKPAKEKTAEPAVVEKTTTERMTEWNAELESLARAFTKFERPVGEWVDESRWGMVQDALKSAAETLRGAKAGGVCPACKGKGCKKCRQTGFAPKQILASIGGGK